MSGQSCRDAPALLGRSMQRGPGKLPVFKMDSHALISATRRGSSDQLHLRHSESACWWLLSGCSCLNASGPGMLCGQPRTFTKATCRLQSLPERVRLCHVLHTLLHPDRQGVQSADFSMSPQLPIEWV